MNTFIDEDGIERSERRRQSREGDDPRIDHLFSGFDNLIQNADAYDLGYLTAMRLEFGQLISSLDRRPSK